VECIVIKLLRSKGTLEQRDRLDRAIQDVMETRR